MNTVPTQEPEVSTLGMILSWVPSWAPWAVGVTLIAAAAWWGLPPLLRTGVPQRAARAAVTWGRDLLIQRLAASTPASPTQPVVASAAEPEAPRDVPPVPLAASPQSAKATVAIAAVPSIASLVWTAWSLMDMLPAPWPVGLAVGVVLDVALVSAVAIAWINPSSASGAKKFGWFVASIAAVLVGWHAFEMLPVLAVLGIVPLVAKGLWHIALNTRLARSDEERRRREAEEEAGAEKAIRDAELSTDPSHEQKRLVAQKRRDAAHERELAEAEVDFDNARAERDHKLKLAAIRRAAQEAREMEREDAETIKQRVALVREIEAGRGLAIGSGSGDGRSPVVASPSASLMGFGSAMAADLGVSRGRPGNVPSVIDPELQELMTYIGSAGDGASVRGAAKELGVAPPTIRRWREKAEKAGLDMSALKRTT